MLQRYGTDSLQPRKNQQKYFYIHLCINDIRPFLGYLPHPDRAVMTLLVKEK